jgi:hypothetical protein
VGFILSLVNEFQKCSTGGRFLRLPLPTEFSSNHGRYSGFAGATVARDWSDSQRVYRIVDKSDWYFADIGPYSGQRSSDDGATWVDWAQMPCPVSFQQLIAPPANTLLMRCEHGLFRSHDAGDSWAKIHPESGEALTVDYGNPQRIFWSRQGKLWASTDQGATWQLLLAPRKVWLPVVGR